MRAIYVFYYSVKKKKEQFNSHNTGRLNIYTAWIWAQLILCNHVWMCAVVPCAVDLIIVYVWLGAEFVIMLICYGRFCCALLSKTHKCNKTVDHRYNYKVSGLQEENITLTQNISKKKNKEWTENSSKVATEETMLYNEWKIKHFFSFEETWKKLHQNILWNLNVVCSLFTVQHTRIKSAIYH